MFERFTDPSRRVVSLSKIEAERLNHDYIGTEHLLLGLVHEGESAAAVLLRDLGVSLDKAREAVERLTVEGAGTTARHIPFTIRAKRVLEQALREANGVRSNYIAPEHILSAILVDRPDGPSNAVEALIELNIDMDQLKSAVGASLEATGVASKAPDDIVDLSKDGVLRVESAEGEALDVLEFTVRYRDKRGVVRTHAVVMPTM